MYGEPPPVTVWASVAELDGRVVGIGGIAYIGEKPVLFSRIKDELRPYRKFIVQAARDLARMAASVKAVAVASKTEALSCRLLARLGMQWFASTPEGEVFVWPTRS